MQAGDPLGFYAILGVGRTASAEEVRRAFRARAKNLHPDGTGPAADEARFRHLREAFETLRDPQRRMRYDAQGLAEGGGSGWVAAAWSSIGGIWRRARAALEVRARWRRVAVTAGLLCCLVLVSAAFLTPGRARLPRHELPAGEAAQTSAAAGAPIEATIYRAELVFPRGSAELAAARAAAIAAELRQAIGSLPGGSGWTVTVAGQVPHLPSAATDAALPGPWHLAIRRLASASEFLARHGVAKERIAASFQAGPLPGRVPLSVPEAIQLALICCESAQSP